MTAKTELRIATGGYNWLSVATEILLGLEGSGYPDPHADYEWDRDSSSVEVIAPPCNRAALTTVEMVGSGEADVAITTPGAIARLAKQGKGPFSDRQPISAVARLPHADRLAFAVREDSDIHSLSEIRDREEPFHLSRSMPHYPPYRNVTGYLIDEVLAQYRISEEQIESNGGTVDYGGRKNIDGLVSGEFDALFDEAMMTPSWHKIAHNTDLRFLPVDEEILSYLEDARGLDRETIPEGYLPGVHEDVPTLSMSGWIVAIGDDVSNEIAYHVTRALDERSEHIDKRFNEIVNEGQYTDPPMTESLDMSKACQDTGVELHPGAADYYQEQGYN